jgi:hypothetical protein
MPSEMFSVLEPSTESRSRRGTAFVCGLFVQVLLIATAVVVGIFFPQELPIAGRQYAMVWHAPLRPPARPAVKPRIQIARSTVPKLKLIPTAQPTLHSVVIPVVPKVRPTVSAAAVRIPEAPRPAPPVSQPRSEPKTQIAVNTGVFGGAAMPVTTKRPVDKVQTGGFGDPRALPGLAHGDSAGNVPKLGSFGLPDGPGVGNGTGGAHGIQGVVASAGFGSGVAGPGYARAGDGSKVSTGAFEQVAQVAQTRTNALGACPRITDLS